MLTMWLWLVVGLFAWLFGLGDELFLFTWQQILGYKTNCEQIAANINKHPGYSGPDVVCDNADVSKKEIVNAKSFMLLER